MSNIFKRNLNKIVTLLLRTAVLTYLVSVVYPYLADPGFESTFGNWALRWGLIIGLGAAMLAIFILNRTDFIRYGFFVIFIASFFQLFVTLLSNDAFPAVLFHVYVMITAVYFFTKDFRSSTHSHHHHHSRKEKSDQ